VPALSSWGHAHTATLFLMSSCLGRCFFCAQPEVLDMPEHMVTRGEAVDAWMARLSGSGARTLLLAGTEPTTHPSFARVLSSAKGHGIERIEVMTSGLALAEPGVAERWFAQGVRAVAVPIYGVTPELHDDVVRVPGHHARLLGALRNAVAAGLVVELHTLALRRLLPHLGDLAAFAHALTGQPLGVAPVRDKPGIFAFASEALRYETLADALRGAPVALVGFPACAAPDLPRGGAPVLALYARGMAHTYGRACAGCPARSRCLGVIPAHLRLFGEGELHAQPE
jgi:pyruvate-formate lyase-activating enzyme